MGYAGGRINTATQREFNAKWLRTPPPKDDILNGRSQAMLPWYSPRLTGTLWENSRAVPEWLKRDQVMLEKLRDRLWPEKKLKASKTRGRASSSLEKGTSRHFTGPKSGTKLNELPAISRSISRTQLQADPVKALGRKGSFDEALEERRREAARQKGLKKTLRTRMQRIFTKTTHLPIELWLEFRKCDDDGSGRIDYAEFCSICERIGLTGDVVGETGKQTLFTIADRDGSGAIDFSEFLNAIVGNLVSI